MHVFCVIQNGANFCFHYISLKTNIVQRLHQNHCVDFINNMKFLLFHCHDILIEFQLFIFEIL